MFYKAVLCIEESLLDEGIRQLPEAFFEKFNCMKSRTFLLEVVHFILQATGCIN